MEIKPQGDSLKGLSSCYKEFEKRINDFVYTLLKDYKPGKYNGNKVIHDPVWGTMVFYPWELQVLDSPLLQRLRRINQVGLVLLTYPAAHHTRFEHTLGVMSVVTKMVTNVNQNNYGSKGSKDIAVISDEDLYKLRFAALMHDVGHCFFSHLSESIYGKLKPFVELKNSVDIFAGAKEHEIFAYLIANSDRFKSFFTEYIDYPFKEKEPHFFDDIGRMIVGAFIEPDSDNKQEQIIFKKCYLTQMINGQFDADKLDYLRRDCYTAGLALTYDIDRFLYKIRLVEKEEEAKKNAKTLGIHLTIPITGIAAVEEMAFSQLMLTSYIYQHQKVLAVDELIKDVAEGLTKNEKLIHPCDYLNYCDDDIYQLYNNTCDGDLEVPLSSKRINSESKKTLSDIVRRVRLRELPKRAFTINSNTVFVPKTKSESDSEKKLTEYKVADIANTLKGIAELRQEICEEAQRISSTLDVAEGGQKEIDIYDIQISIPKRNVGKDLSNAFVVTSDGIFEKLSDIVRFSDWADAFSYHKWNAYVFARTDICSIVSIASKIVFERHGIIFNEDKVFKSLKIEKEILEMNKILLEKYQYQAE